MSIKRFNAKRDGNEPEIVAALEANGWTVRRQDLPDLLVCRRGAVRLIEVKASAKAKLKPSQQQLIDDGFPLVVIWSVEQVADLR